MKCCIEISLQVAVKEARETIGFDEDIYQEVLMEAHTIHGLEHDNVTSLYGVKCFNQ